MTDRTLSRRQLLRGSAALGAGIYGLDRLMGLGGGAAVARADQIFQTPLRFPPVLSDDQVVLTAAVGESQVFPTGPATQMWMWNGTFPGPTIRRRSGTPAEIKVIHDLPAGMGTLTVHNHGAHTTPPNDGQPRPEFYIHPGETRIYRYPMVEDGAPERATQQWYHDHTHGHTERNNWHGLVGLFVIDDDFEDELRAAGKLPAIEDEILLVIAGRGFDDNNQLIEPGDLESPPPFDDTPATEHLVNGILRPYHEVEARQYRLRILNAASFHPYNLSLGGGGSLTQIGTEAGLLPAPVEQGSYTIGPAERVDLLADFSGLQGRSVTLESHTFSNARPGATEPAEPVPGGQLMQFRVGAPTVSRPIVIPPVIRPLPDWTAEVDGSTVDWVWAFGLGVDPTQAPGGDVTQATAWTVNGRTFDPERVDHKAELGTIETWALINASGYPMSHYIHIHNVDWYEISRNGQAPTGGESGLKETFRLDPGEIVLVASKFTDNLGQYMVHCHMLNHEDHGMMTNWAVVEPGQGDKLPQRASDVAEARLAGRRVRVPLDGLAPAARPGVRDALRQVSERPGRPARLSAEPVLLPAGSNLYCSLHGRAPVL